MANPGGSLPSNVLDALRGGNKVEAIKRLRQATGLGLAEAKQLVDAHASRVSGKRASTSTSTSTPSPLPANQLPAAVAEAIQRGSVIEAIRLLRDQKGMGLKEAKDALERARPLAERSAGGPPEMFNLFVNALWWVLALILGGFAAYYFLR